VIYGIGVIFHYLNKNLKVRSLLVRIRRIHDSYNRENIIKTIITILLEMGIKDQLDFFIGDNTTINNTIIRAILTYLRPNIKDPNSRRIRCFNYIINLTAKAFLFSKDADAFKEESYTKKKLSKLKAVRELWRKKGPLRKFYNIVSFIRKTP
jgi:hypothetical protein